MVGIADTSESTTDLSVVAGLDPPCIKAEQRATEQNADRLDFVSIKVLRVLIPDHNDLDDNIVFIELCKMSRLLPQ